MKNKSRKFIDILIKGQLLGVVYERVFVYFITECLGKISLWFYRIIYRNITIGKKVKCWGRPIIVKSPNSSISIGNNARIGSDFVRAGIALYSRLKLQAGGEAKIIIGNNVAMSGTSITCRTTKIEIGDDSMIAPNVVIVDSDFHNKWPPENRTHNMGYENDRPVTIDKNVWIGMNSIILKGVAIGENSVIAAGSVVVKDVPRNVVAGGNPAKVIKELGK